MNSPITGSFVAEKMHRTGPSVPACDGEKRGEFRPTFDRKKADYQGFPDEIGFTASVVGLLMRRSAEIVAPSLQ